MAVKVTAIRHSDCSDCGSRFSRHRPRLRNHRPGGQQPPPPVRPDAQNVQDQGVRPAALKPSGASCPKCNPAKIRPVRRGGRKLAVSSGLLLPELLFGQKEVQGLFKTIFVRLRPPPISLVETLE
jgi:hypothetical protein